jgi:hypothetical protein
MTHSPCWAAFRQLFRKLLHADPRYHWENDWSMDPWKSPSEVPPMPAIPLVVNGKTMGLDPTKVRIDSPYRVTR